MGLFWIPRRTENDPSGKLTASGNISVQGYDPGRNVNIFRAIIRPQLLGAFLVAFFATMLYNSIPANISMLLTENGLGGNSAAGTASALLLLASAVSGMLFGKVSSVIHDFVVVLGFGVLTAGAVICALSSSVLLLYAGCLLAGGALGFIMPRKLFDATQCKGVRSEIATMLTMAGSYLGSFVTPVLTGAAGKLFGSGEVSNRFILASILAAAVAIVLTVKTIFKGSVLRSETQIVK